MGGSSSFEEKDGEATDYPVPPRTRSSPRDPTFLILPDEPYRFRERDAAFWRERLPATTRVVLVSGDDFCWHGTRTLRGLEAAGKLAGMFEDFPFRPDAA